MQRSCQLVGILQGGVRGSEMTTPSVPALPVPETGQQWQGSRLGPLAPGAGETLGT